MKKGKYIDIYVMMACMSGKKSKSNLKHVDELLDKACTYFDKTKKDKTDCEFCLEQEEPVIGSYNHNH